MEYFVSLKAALFSASWSRAFTQDELKAEFNNFLDAAILSAKDRHRNNDPYRTWGRLLNGLGLFSKRPLLGQCPKRGRLLNKPRPFSKRPRVRYGSLFRCQKELVFYERSQWPDADEQTRAGWLLTLSNLQRPELNQLVRFVAERGQCCDLGI